MERNVFCIRGNLVPVLMLALGLGGCAGIRPADSPAKQSRFYSTEAMLGTEDGDSQKFHAVVHYPFEHALRFPGLIVGVEKSKAPAVRDGLTADVIDAGHLGKKALLSQSKAMFISHVVKTEYREDSIYAAPRPSFVYNAYQPENLTDAAYRYDIDNISLQGDGESIPPPRIDDYFAAGWTAIDRIKGVLTQELRGHRYTHVVVIVMGWNTQQIEAMQNFNSIVDRMAGVANENRENEQDGRKLTFRPYVIGVTWPSEWAGGQAKHAVSLFNKANDADEFGGGWLAALFEYAIYPAINETKEPRTPLMVIGHSFGARASSHAVCVGSYLKNPSGTLPFSNGVVDKLIALEGAYSLNRFTNDGAGAWHFKYDNKCSAHANHLIFTASKNDTAAEGGAAVIEGGHFAGSFRSYEQALAPCAQQDRKCEQLHEIPFTAYRAIDSRGNLKRIKAAGSDQFRYVDASSVIFYEAYATGAGAHSDIYRTDTARMIWNLINDNAQ